MASPLNRIKPKQDLLALKIVHEGRGGYIEVGGFRYGIELFDGGKFAIHFPCGNRSVKRFDHLRALNALCRNDPTWAIENHSRPLRRRGAAVKK